MLSIAPPRGPGVLTERDLVLTMVGVIGVENASYRVPGASSVVDLEPRRRGGDLRLDLGRVELTAGIEVTLDGLATRASTIVERTFALLDQAEIAYELKDRIMTVVDTLDREARPAALHGIGAPDALYGALLEILASDATA